MQIFWKIFHWANKRWNIWLALKNRKRWNFCFKRNDFSGPKLLNRTSSFIN